MLAEALMLWTPLFKTEVINGFVSYWDVKLLYTNTALLLEKNTFFLLFAWKKPSEIANPSTEGSMGLSKLSK